jgi:hypothetical protein
MNATKQNFEHIINEVAQEYNLNVVSTTVGMNGYPSHVNIALEGFESFEQYCEVRDKYSMQEYKLHRKDGWNLWQRICDSFFEAWSNELSYNEDRERVWSKSDKDSFLEFQYNDFFDRLNNYFTYDAEEDIELSKFVTKWEDFQVFFDYCKKNEIELCEDVDDMLKAYGEKNEIYAKFDEINDNQIIIEYYQYASGYDVVSKHTCSYYEDTHHYSMGLGFEIDDLPEE